MIELDENSQNIILHNDIQYITTESILSWKNSSYDVDGDDLTESIWKINGNITDNPNGKLPEGENIISLKVKDNNGKYSEEVNYNINVIKFALPETPGDFNDFSINGEILKGSVINLSWGDISNWGNPDIDKKYILEKNTGSDWELLAETITNNYTFNVPENIEFLQFRVKSKTIAGESSWVNSNIYQLYSNAEYEKYSLINVYSHYTTTYKGWSFGSTEGRYKTKKPPIKKVVFVFIIKRGDKSPAVYILNSFLSLNSSCFPSFQF